MSDSHSIRSCAFEGCGRPAIVDLCYTHDRRRREGKPLIPLRNRSEKGVPPTIRYQEATCPNHDLVGPCHITMHRNRKDGYRDVYDASSGKIVLVHRYVWEKTKGPIPPGLEIDHQCRVRACCNVDHLRVVTKKVNTTENSNSVGAKNKVKTHCPKGHEFTPENTKIAKKNGARACRQCHKEDNKARNERKRREDGILKRGTKPFCKYGHPFNEENTYYYRGVRRCRTCHREQVNASNRKKKEDDNANLLSGRLPPRQSPVVESETGDRDGLGG